MAYSACWRSHTSELDLALARRLSSCGRRRSPAARTLTNCTCGEGAAALLAVAKGRRRGRHPLQLAYTLALAVAHATCATANPELPNKNLDGLQAFVLCPVWRALNRYKKPQHKGIGKAQRRVEGTVAKKSGVITRFFVSLFMYPLILSV
jgi:hypothetical protein